MKFRKRPVVIEAMQFFGTMVSSNDIFAWMDEHEDSPPASYTGTGDPSDGFLLIDTLEGEMRANAGDWIIRGVKGEFYPCKPDIFSATYEPAE